MAYLSVKQVRKIFIVFLIPKIVDVDSGEFICNEPIECDNGYTLIDEFFCQTMRKNFHPVSYQEDL